MSGRRGTSAEDAAPHWGYQTSFWQPRQPAFWLFVVTLVLTGLVALGLQADMISFAPEAWLLTLVLLAPYAIPVVLVVYYLDLYEREPLSIVGAALLWGGIAATTLSLFTNVPLAELVYKVTGDPVFTQDWSAALTAPFVEEAFKAFGIVLLVSIARNEMDDLLDGFVWGAMVGVGFLVVEDLFYFIDAYATAGGSYAGIVEIFFIRVIGAGPYSHFLYTGLVGMGIACWVTRGDVPRGRRGGIAAALVAAGIGAHFAWNSPLLVELLGEGTPLNWLVYMTAKGLPMLIGLLILVRLARGRERRWFERFAEAAADDATITPAELHELGGLRRRWRARRGAARTGGPAAGRLRGQIQRQQITLAMIASRTGTADHPDVVKQRDLVRALKAQYAALVAARAAGGAGGEVGSGADVAGGTAGWIGTAARSGPLPPSGPSIASPWLPTHRVPDEGMAAWAAPDPTQAPTVSLAGRLELIVVQEAGAWAQVVAVNGWSGWVDGRRLIPLR